jgi:hypothetical protein
MIAAWAWLGVAHFVLATSFVQQIFNLDSLPYSRDFQFVGEGEFAESTMWLASSQLVMPQSLDRSPPARLSLDI